jgi:hypothetical protein
MLKVEISGHCSVSATRVAEWLATTLKDKGFGKVKIDVSQDDKDCVKGFMRDETALVVVNRKPRGDEPRTRE